MTSYQRDRDEDNPHPHERGMPAGVEEAVHRARVLLGAVRDALAYVETLGRQTETATEYPARLNSNCSYCDHRKQCPTYADALKGKREFIVEDLADLEGVAREREVRDDVAARAAAVRRGDRDRCGEHRERLAETHPEHPARRFGVEPRLHDAAQAGVDHARRAAALTDDGVAL